MFSFKQLQIFTSLAQTKNIKVTAKFLHQTRSNISIQMNKLEELVSLKLFKSLNTPCELTSNGKDFLIYAQNIMQKIKQSEEYFKDNTSELEGKIKVAGSLYFIEQDILPTLNQFNEQFPQIHCVFTTEEHRSTFDMNEFDLLYGVTLHEPMDNLVQLKVANYDQVLCASPKFLEKHGTPKECKELQTLDYIAHGGSKEINNISLKGHKLVPVNKVMEVNTYALQKDCALQDLGFIYLPHYVVEQELKDGSLISFLDDEAAKDLPLYLYYQSNRYIDPKIRGFIDFYTKKTAKKG